MSDTFFIKQRDSSPNIKAYLRNDEGNPVDLSKIEKVMFHLEERNTEELIFEKEAQVADAEQGKVFYDWDREDTNQDPGAYSCEWLVDYGNDVVETFPNDGWNTVIITRKIS